MILSFGFFRSGMMFTICCLVGLLWVALIGVYLFVLFTRFG